MILNSYINFYRYSTYEEEGDWDDVWGMGVLEIAPPAPIIDKLINSFLVIEFYTAEETSVAKLNVTKIKDFSIFNDYILKIVFW